MNTHLNRIIRISNGVQSGGKSNLSFLKRIFSVPVTVPIFAFNIDFSREGRMSKARKIGAFSRY
jgi:hypothetical protein